MRGYYAGNALLIACILAASVYGADPERDFSGKWTLDPAASTANALGPTETSLAISQSDVGILCSTGPAQWSYALDGSETRKTIGEESRSSIAKWEGAALLINTQVSGPQDYTLMERWQLSPGRNTLTITRQLVRAAGLVEGVLVFRREGVPMTPAVRPVESRPAPAADLPRQTLATRPAPGLPPDITVPSGTRVLLQLVGEVSTKRARDGDHVYLRTASPVAVDGRVVVPRGSDVQGTITRTKPAGRVSGKGELYIRFDQLILTNGVSRDFHARPPGAEGQVPGNGKAADGRTVLYGTGMGASIGAITRGLPGAAVGGGIGALAGVLLSRNQDVVLPAGTHVEMVLDRDLVFHPEEIP
jgi:type IV secretion system protein VirB10